MKSTYMFPSALVTGSVAIISLVFLYPKGDMKSLYALVAVIIAFVGYLQLYGRQETDMFYRSFRAAQIGFVSPCLLAILFIYRPATSLWGLVVFLVVLIVHDWRLYETSPAGAFSIRHVPRFGVVWENTLGMTPPEIRRMRKQQKAEQNN